MARKKSLPRRKFLTGLMQATGISMGALLPDWVQAQGDAPVHPQMDPLTDSSEKRQENETQPPLRSIGSSGNFLSRPYVQFMGNHQVCIRFITQYPSYGWVEWTDDQGKIQKIDRVTDGMTEANEYLHQFTLPLLKGKKKNQYKVFAQKIEEFQPYKLTFGTTESLGPFDLQYPEKESAEARWLVLNDIHDRPQSFKELLALVPHKKWDYVFLNGDMFDYQTDQQQLIDHLLNPCSETFAQEKPFLFVRGNHETRGKFARKIHQYFTNPYNLQDQTQQYFSYVHGPVFSIALDTGEDKPDDHPVYAGLVHFDAYREKQAQWLEQTLQSPEAKKAAFRIVHMHIPPFYSGDWHGTLHCRKVFSSLFDQYKVDLVLSGHTHKMGIHLPVKGQHSYPIVIGGGPKTGSRTIIELAADQKKCTVKMYQDDGKIFGDLVLTSRK